MRSAALPTNDPAPAVTTRARDPLVPASTAVTALVVRVAGVVPVRMDLTHAGTSDQQLGMSTGKVLVYLRSGWTVLSVAEGWRSAATHARRLPPAIPGQRRLPIGPSFVSAMVQIGGIPTVTAAFEPSREGSPRPAMVRIRVGPVIWEVCDATAYASLLRAWRQAAQLLGEHPGDDD